MDNEVKNEEKYEITCRACNGVGKVKKQVKPEHLDPKLLKQGVPVVEIVCPACNGVGKITAYKKLDILMQKMHHKSDSNMIMNMGDSVLLVYEDTVCSICEKTTPVSNIILVTSMGNSGTMEREYSAQMTVCSECMKKIGVTEDMLIKGKQNTPKVIIANGNEVK